MYKLILPLRFMFSRPISCLAVAAIAVCVFIVVVVLTVMNGLVVEFREKNHRYVGDCVVVTESLTGFTYYEKFRKRLQDQDYVQAVSVTVRGFGLLSQTNADRNIGVELTGLDPAVHSRVTNFANTLHYKKNDIENAFVPDYAPDARGCIVGIDKMPSSRTRSGVYYHPPVPTQFELMISAFPLTSKGLLARAGMGRDLVNTMTFYYSDDSRSGLVKVDGNMIYIPFETAQQLLGMDGPEPRASSVHIKFRPGVKLSDGVKNVSLLWRDFKNSLQGDRYFSLLQTVQVQSWKQNRREIIAPMEKEQIMLIALFIMLGVITVFIIYVVFYMIVNSKSKDIGILKSLGVSNFSIGQIFLTFSVLIGLTGAAIGSSLGCWFLIRINDMEAWLYENYNWQLWDRSVYAIDEIPNEIRAGVIGAIIASAILACLLGAVIPAAGTARKKCARILQVNQL